MGLHDFVGKVIDEPIKSNAGVGDIRLIWDQAQLSRVKGLTLRSIDNKTTPYTLLYFTPGLTTYCGIRGIPVVTGYMSGCYLFRFRHNGELRAAHVGTHDNLKEWSDKAKDAWKALAQAPGVSDIFGFDPLKDVDMRLLQEGMKIGNPQIIGVWEGNGSARIGVVATPKGHPGKKQLVGLQPAPLRPWSSIRSDPKML